MFENQKHNEKMKKLKTSKEKIFAKKTEKRSHNSEHWNRQGKEYSCLWYGF